MLQGQAFLVQGRKEEDIIQLYEAEKYEVRCEIVVRDGGVVERGLTFWFVGECDPWQRLNGYLGLGKTMHLRSTYLYLVFAEYTSWGDPSITPL